MISRFIAFLILALALLGCTAGAPPAQLTAAPTAAGAGDAIVWVGDAPITESRFADQQRIVAHNLSYMRGQIEAGNDPEGFLARTIALMEQTGTPTVAFAGLIADEALFQQALREGYDATPEQVAEKVASDRAMIESAQANDPFFTEELERVGSERFWADIYPDRAWRALILDQFWAAHRVAPPTREELYQQAMAAAPVRIVRPEALAGATVQGAMDYLAAYQGVTAR